MSTAEQPAWLQATIEVPAEHAAAAESALSDAGALSVTLADAGDRPVLEPAPGETPLWPHTTVTGLFDGQSHDADSIRPSLVAALGPQAEALRVAPLEQRDWVRAWTEHVRPMRFGHRLWVCPHHLQPPDPTAVTLRLDPGLAFGTGTHPTTALCLEWLEANSPTGVVLDYGCGSGILAVAAALLGARRVLAVDIDTQALIATRDNAERNGVGQRVAAYLPERCPRALADVAVANILAGPLVALASLLAGRLRPGASLILSGLLSRHAPEVVAGYGSWFDESQRAEREGWLRIDLIRNDTDSPASKA